MGSLKNGKTRAFHARRHPHPRITVASVVRSVTLIKRADSFEFSKIDRQHVRWTHAIRNHPICVYKVTKTLLFILLRFLFLLIIVNFTTLFVLKK